MASSVQKFKETIAEKIRALQSGFDLGYEGDDPFEFQCNGDFFLLPARGRLTIKDRYGYATNFSPLSITQEEKRAARTVAMSEFSSGRKPNAKLKVVVPALTVIEFAASKYGDRGVYFHTGNVEEDKVSKAEARANYIAWRTKESEQILRSYETRTESFSRNPRNHGRLAPPMGERELKAQEFLDDQKVVSRGRKEFTCPAEFCGYSANDEERIKTHLEAAHPTLDANKEAVQTRASDRKKKAS